MIYKCKNCDGNMIYHVEERKLYCPYCNSMDTEKCIDGKVMEICDSCGGKLSIGPYDSVGKCPYCSQYVIYNERIEGEYKPSGILPFKVGKEQAKTMIRVKYRNKRYVPKSFLTEASLRKMEGTYVPFWLYDINVNVDFQGKGMRERISSNENSTMPEIVYYDVYRNFDAAFRKMPVDASLAMPDEIMDMLEPFDYRELEKFEPKYMSGFLGEIYSNDAKYFEARAGKKIQRDVRKLLDKELDSFKIVTPVINKMSMEYKGVEYVLLPVWRYLYTYRGEQYEYYINGQSGKVIGEAPVSKGKMVANTSAAFLIGLVLGWLLFTIMLGTGVEVYVFSPVLAVLTAAVYMFLTWPKKEKRTATERTFLGCLRMNDTRDILKRY